MDATKQKLIDVCKINIQDDEMWIKLATERKEESLLQKALADKEKHEKLLAELLEGESGRGGVRPGAGRKRLGSELRKPLSLSVTATEAEQVKACLAFLRVPNNENYETFFELTKTQMTQTGREYSKAGAGRKRLGTESRESKTICVTASELAKVQSLIKLIREPNGDNLDDFNDITEEEFSTALYDWIEVRSAKSK